MTTYLRPLWRRLFGQAWIFVAVLFVLLVLLRAYVQLWAREASWVLMLVFLAMWVLPFVCFTRPGRAAMGLIRPARPAWLLWGALLGFAAALLAFGIGYGLYGAGPDNWYVSVRDHYLVDPSVLALPPVTLFIMFTVPAMLFSPVGEEFFFRGMLHESVRERWGDKAAVAVNSLAFAGVHVLHHGVAMDAAGLEIRWVSGLLWVGLMAMLSVLFTLCRLRGGSIWPAVLAHSAFNLGMNATIFFVLV